MKSLADPLPVHLTISQAARACSVPERRLRGLVDSGRARFTVCRLHDGPNARRFLIRSQVEEWARLYLGHAPDYAPLLDELL